ncbi:MAG: HEAT repeat domain-containing protein [Chloroflexota bacterium]
MADPNEVEKLIKQLSHRDSEKRWEAAFSLWARKDTSTVPHLILALDDPERHVRYWAADALGTLGDRVAVPRLIKALGDSDGGVRSAADSALTKFGYGGAVPHLIKAFDDYRKDVRAAAAEVLRKLGIKEPARLKLDFNKDSWPRAGEFAPHAIAFSNDGEGPAFDLRLSLAGPAVGRKTSLHFRELLPGGKVSSTISVCPEAPGSTVPLHWELTYDDINGPNQKLAGASYIEVASRASQPSVNIGTFVGGSVDGVVVGKVNSQQDKPFTICPYCGESLNLPKTPRFCPYCKEKLAEN